MRCNGTARRSRSRVARVKAAHSRAVSRRRGSRGAAARNAHPDGRSYNPPKRKVRVSRQEQAAMEVEDLGHHISRRFNEDLERVRNSVLTMGGLVEDQLDRAIRALAEADSELGLQVAENDAKVNKMEVGIDEECSRILATRAPTAGDLRLIIAVIKTITDLERVGDEAEKIGVL